MKKNNLVLGILILCASLSANCSNLDNLILPDGFEISIFADELNTPRQISETDKGYVIVGTKKRR